MFLYCHMCVYMYCFMFYIIVCVLVTFNAVLLPFLARSHSHTLTHMHDERQTTRHTEYLKNNKGKQKNAELIK